MAERWLPVPGWPGYEVSDRGRVRSVERVIADGRTAAGVLLKPSRDKDGYRYVTLSDGSRRRKVHVARLVLEAFTGPCPDGMEVLHGNGRRWDNRLGNLRYGTDGENSREREDHRRIREDRRSSRMRGTEEKERETSEIGKGSPTPVNAVSGVSCQ